MRTIKSNDGRIIVNAVNVFFVGIKNNTIIACNTTEGNGYIPLAVYSTEKRALQVLDMLNEWLTMQRTFSSFRMPQDSEELDA